MGKVDQGFVVLWAARHLFGGPLSYNGFGGAGLQVRDVLDIRDLYRLISKQIGAIETHNGQVYNVGGGTNGSVSLTELTELCARRAGRRVAIGSRPQTDLVDIPFYVTDNTAIATAIGWRPEISINETLDDIFEWLRDHRAEVEGILQ
jgi:CDP-paratose 2-epimerase